MILKHWKGQSFTKDVCRTKIDCIWPDAQQIEKGPPWREIHFIKDSNKVDDIPIIINITQNLNTDITDMATCSNTMDTVAEEVAEKKTDAMFSTLDTLTEKATVEETKDDVAERVSNYRLVELLLFTFGNSYLFYIESMVIRVTVHKLQSVLNYIYGNLLCYKK